MTIAASVVFTDTAYTGGAAVTAPVSATEGLDLATVTHFRVIVSADSGQTLSGTGNLRAYFYSPALSRWVKSPDLDFAVTSPNAAWVNVQDRGTGDYDDVVSFGRVVFRPDLVGVSSGNVTVTIEAWKAP